MRLLTRRHIALVWATVGVSLLWAYAARPVDVASSRPDQPVAVAGVEPGPGTSPSVSTTPRHDADVAPAPTPTRLRLPRLGLVAPVVTAGLTADGAMQIPKDPDIVGWYANGPRPGSANGSVVLAGHVNSRKLGSGVLAQLTEVQIGDDVIVAVGDGRGFVYRVVKTEQFHKRELPLSTIFNPNGRPVLRLVTCSGRFLGSGLGYEDNLVVTAVPLATASH